jgi:hypothetical protein
VPALKSRQINALTNRQDDGPEASFSPRKEGDASVKKEKPKTSVRLGLIALATAFVWASAVEESWGQRAKQRRQQRLEQRAINNCSGSEMAVDQSRRCKRLFNRVARRGGERAVASVMSRVRKHEREALAHENLVQSARRGDLDGVVSDANAQKFKNAASSP